MGEVALLEKVQDWLSKESSSPQLIDTLVKADQDSNVKENVVLEVAKRLKEAQRTQDLEALLLITRQFLNEVTKAKAAKLIHCLVEQYLDCQPRTGREISTIEDCVAWAVAENRVFMRQELQAKLIRLYYENTRYQDAIQLSSQLLRELKKIDDKQLTVEVQLLESQVYYALTNVPKARAALTSGKTTANSIYVGPKLQADLDMQSGVLHAAESDFKTAYSYFIEAFEAYDNLANARAMCALKYMLLSKIILGLVDDVSQILTLKSVAKYHGIDLDAMKAVADASKKRSLADFTKAVEQYSEQIHGDPVIREHLDVLNDRLLEENLLKLIEPFSQVQVSHIAELIQLPYNIVERKLSQMILDKTLTGILNQGQGVLIVYDVTPVDKTYEAALDCIQQMGKVVDQLFERANKLT